MSAALLVRALRDPASVAGLDASGWNGLIAAARAERLIGTLAFRLDGETVPPALTPILSDARLDAAREARQALWEADRGAQALGALGVRVVLLKGTAYAAAGLKAGQGRFIDGGLVLGEPWHMGVAEEGDARGAHLCSKVQRCRPSKGMRKIHIRAALT